MKNGVKRVCVAFGTRPEASKMAPVIFALAKQEGLAPITLVTGQHREQLEDVLRVFCITPDADLAVMTERQTLPELTARIVPQAASMLRTLEPDYVLVHGDTLTTFAVALASFFEGIPLGHVEAGLRSFNLEEPFPEEANRRLTDVLTDLDLPPTPWAKANLLREGKNEARLVVTGNTAVDAVRYLSRRVVLPEHLPPGPYVTITMHRRENLPAMREIARVLAEVAKSHPRFTFVYPVHLNPAVREAVWEAMSGVPNLILEDPWNYRDMLALLKASALVITDSGGIQEEGAALGVPVVVMRNLTERPEGIEAGVLKLAGNDPGRIRETVVSLLASPEALADMRGRENPYGDGRAGERIAQAVAWRFGLADRPKDWR
jgi:UDP-N-acetylglucosamine 2-epimerase (non-hydrolysing)